MRDAGEHAHLAVGARHRDDGARIARFGTEARGLLACAVQHHGAAVRAARKRCKRGAVGVADLDASADPGGKESRDWLAGRVPEREVAAVGGRSEAHGVRTRLAPDVELTAGLARVREQHDLVVRADHLDATRADHLDDGGVLHRGREHGGAEDSERDERSAPPAPRVPACGVEVGLDAGESCVDGTVRLRGAVGVHKCSVGYGIQ